MKRGTPPLDAIEAFMQAARTASFREAADALAISPSAFSRRLQALESFLGVALFDRAGPRPALNETGRKYLEAIAPAIEAIRLASLPSAGRGASHAAPLRVMAPHSFTIGWLAPRLADFMARPGNPEIELTISRDLAPLRLGTTDVAIVSGPRDWAGLPVELLAPLTGVLASAPLLAGGKPPPRHLGELAQHRLLSVSSPPDLWGRWLRGVGYQGPAVNAPVLYDTASLLYEAAAAGFGLAVAVPFLADRLLASGRLRRIGSASAAIGVDYYLVCASERARRRPEVRAFCTWAHAQAEDTLAAFEKNGPPNAEVAKVAQKSQK